LARVGAAKARHLLQQIMAEFGVSLADLQGRSRTENICLAKQAFIFRSGELKIPIVVMAEALGVTRGTIHSRSNPKIRARKVLRERRRRAAKRRASSFPTFGTNHFVIGSVYPRGIYTQFLAGEGR
jgi:hypothetical protein